MRLVGNTVNRVQLLLTAALTDVVMAIGPGLSPKERDGLGPY
jgi:hypothetical protein